MSSHSLRIWLCGVSVLAAAGCANPGGVLPHASEQVPAGVWRAGSADEPAQSWQRWKVRRDKKETDYSVVTDDVPQADGGLRAQSVLKAIADGSASGLRYELSLDLKQTPLLRWQWKVSDLIADADNTRRDLEDAPVRLILVFAGDRASLPFRERLIADQVRLLTGNELPYATLMYIWENRQPEGSVIDNTYTSRVKMIVAQSGRAGVGQWQTRERDVVADFERAFGEPPGRLIGVSVMTDTDNTGGHAVAYYGGFQFMARSVATAAQ